MKRFLAILLAVGLGLSSFPSSRIIAAQSLPVKVDQSTPVNIPQQPKAQVAQQNDIVHITRTGKKYHRAGCRYLNQSDIPVTREQAIRMGLTPCSVCNP